MLMWNCVVSLARISGLASAPVFLDLTREKGGVQKEVQKFWSHKDPLDNLLTWKVKRD